MNLNLQLGKFSFRIGGEKKQAARSFSASTINRLNSDWLMPQTSIDAEIASGLKTLRGRARELERRNPYVQRYLDLLDNNVLGSCGIGLHMKVTDPSGSLDKAANDLISQAWEKWGERKNCTPSGQVCWREIESLALRRSACDGGLLLRVLRGWDNEFKFAVQPLEMDYLATDYNLKLRNGREVRFGIEFDEWKKPVAFYIFGNHPGDLLGGGNQYTRIDASDLIHVYWSERPGQSVGIPWMSCVMQELENLGKYREAELVAARLEACKGYAIKQAMPDGYTGEKDASGAPVQEMTPGMGMLLNPGEELIQITPTHPNTAHGEYVKSCLRGIAGGLGVSYNSLANDLESVNYSSMRAGKLEEMEEYKNIQGWMIESLHDRVFTAWLEMALMSGAIKFPLGSKLPLSKFDKFNAPDWKPRRWPWVDPQKDLTASVLAVEKGFKSRRQVIAEMGGDIEEVFLEQSEDEKLAEEYDLEFPIGTNPQPQQEPVADDNGKVDSTE